MNPPRPRLLAFGFLWWAASLLAVETAPGPFFWKVTGAGLERPSYLMGTIHLGGSKVQSIAEATEAVLAEVDTLVTEIPMDAATMQKAGRLLVAPEDAPPLSEQLGPELSRQAEAFLSERFPGLSLALFERFEPWAFYITLMTLEMQDAFPGQALDLQLYLRARVAKIETVALETVEEQIAAMEVLTLADVRRLLVAELDQAGPQAQVTADLSAMLDAYLQGDLVSFMSSYLAEMEDLAVPRELIDRFMKSLLYDRDIRMAERIEARLRQHPERAALYAVGAMHVAGEKGIPARLKAAGFTVERLPYRSVTDLAAP